MADVTGLDFPRPAAASDYVGYARHKGWCGIDERRWPEFVETFDAELRGIPLAGRRVLEVGFGNGEFLRFAAERGALVTGLEINPELVLRQQALGRDVRVSRFYDDTSIPERTFHLVLAFDVLEHLTPDEIRSFLGRAAAVLLPGGHLALRFPNGRSPFGLYHQAGDLTHRTLLSAEAIAQVALPLGFVVLRAGNAYRDRGRTPALRAVKAFGYAIRNLLELLLGLLYFGKRIPLDANVTTILRFLPQ